MYGVDDDKKTPTGLKPNVGPGYSGFQLYRCSGTATAVRKSNHSKTPSSEGVFASQSVVYRGSITPLL